MCRYNMVLMVLSFTVALLGVGGGGLNDSDAITCIVWFLLNSISSVSLHGPTYIIQQPACSNTLLKNFQGKVHPLTERKPISWRKEPRALMYGWVFAVLCAGNAN